MTSENAPTLNDGREEITPEVKGPEPRPTASTITDTQLDELYEELAGARATIDHMTKAMSWICGHDRQGLDHLEEAQYEARSRMAAVEQARAWATRARAAEDALKRAARRTK